jgi:hypothetical protein
MGSCIPLNKNKNNGKHKNYCRNWCSEERNFSILKELSERYHLYYSITIKKHLRIFMKALWRKTAMHDIEKMDCALSASCRYIILSGFVLMQLLLKIKEVATKL